jgi:transglutaminase-like putative cysteine protease
MVAIFEHIRDIPYSLEVPMTDPATAPEQLLKFGRGYCGPKHFLLAKMYNKLGLSVVFATIAFLWNDPDLHYTPELRALAARLPVAHHLACRVQIGGCWVLVDATWDLPLKKGGFPVNEKWDGYLETQCAVKPLRSAVRKAFCPTATNKACRAKRGAEFSPPDGEKDHWDAEDRSRYYQEIAATRTPGDIEQIHRFYQEFEEWLVWIRGRE